MGALCRKKQYQRRLVRVLAMLAPAALFLVCLVSLAGQANAESRGGAVQCLRAAGFA